MMRSFKPVSPVVTIPVPAGVIRMTGDTPNPAKVESVNNTTVLPLEKGQAMRFDATTGSYELTLQDPTQVTSQHSQTKVTGPTSYEPPKAPTIGELKKEERKTWLYVALFGGVAAAVFGLVKDWHVIMVGGGCIAAAAYLGIFVIDHPALIIIIAVAGGFAVAGPYLWNFRGFKRMAEDKETNDQ